MAAEPHILFAHGAGAGSTSDWMRGWTRRLRRIGAVTTFDYPYVRAGRRRPDRHPVLLEAHRTALARVRRRATGPVYLAGKSMGSRIGCHLALEERVDAVFCFGYPLRSPAGKLRDQVLLELDTPILFLSGTRDSLCPLPLLDDVRGRMSAPSVLHVTDGGDHSIRVGKRALAARSQTQSEVDDAILAAIGAFLR